MDADVHVPGLSELRHPRQRGLDHADDGRNLQAGVQDRTVGVDRAPCNDPFGGCSRKICLPPNDLRDWRGRSRLTHHGTFCYALSGLRIAF